MILFRHRKLGITALLFKTEIGVDGITSSKLRDFVSNLFYHTRCIHTGDERKLVAPAFVNKNVNRINRRSHHPNEHFIIFRLRSRRIFILQYFRAAAAKGRIAIKTTNRSKLVTSKNGIPF